MAVEVELTANFTEVVKQIEDHARERMEEAVNEVRNKTLENLSGSRSGREYYVPGTKTRYVASAQDEYPASATGELRQSIKAVVEGDGKQVVGMVGTDKEHGTFLEFKPPERGGRPWLRRTFEESEAKIKEIFTRKWF